MGIKSKLEVDHIQDITLTFYFKIIKDRIRKFKEHTWYTAQLLGNSHFPFAKINISLNKILKIILNFIIIISKYKKDEKITLQYNPISMSFTEEIFIFYIFYEKKKKIRKDKTAFLYT